MRNEPKDETESAPNPWRAALKRKRWTLAHLAAEAGYSITHVATAVREPRLMSPALARRLAEVLEIEARS